MDCAIKFQLEKYLNSLTRFAIGINMLNCDSETKLVKEVN